MTARLLTALIAMLISARTCAVVIVAPNSPGVHRTSSALDDEVGRDNGTTEPTQAPTATDPTPIPPTAAPVLIPTTGAPSDGKNPHPSPFPTDGRRGRRGVSRAIKVIAWVLVVLGFIGLLGLVGHRFRFQIADWCRNVSQFQLLRVRGHWRHSAPLSPVTHKQRAYFQLWGG